MACTGAIRGSLNPPRNLAPWNWESDVQREEGRQRSRFAEFVGDYRADVRAFGDEGRIAGVRGLGVELAAVVRQFPTGDGANDQQVAGEPREVRGRGVWESTHVRRSTVAD